MTDAELITTTETPILPVPIPDGESALRDFRRAREIAQVVMSELEPLGVFVNIGRGPKASRHLTIRGWQMIARWVGVTASTEGTTRLLDADGHWVGYQATAIALSSSGEQVGRASARCLEAENNWHGRPEFALESMAETRAKSKCLRDAVGPIVWLAGQVEGYQGPSISDSPFEINDHRTGKDATDLDFEEPAGAPVIDSVTVDGVTHDALPIPETFTCPREFCSFDGSGPDPSLSQRFAKGGDNKNNWVVKCRHKDDSFGSDGWCNKEWKRESWKASASRPNTG